MLTGASGPLAATLTYDTLRFGEFEDFPETSDPVWILGSEYNALTGRTFTEKKTVFQFQRIKLASPTLSSVCAL